MVLNLPGIGKDEGMLLGPKGSSSSRRFADEEEVVFIRQPRVATVIVALDGTGDTDSIQEGINLVPSGGGVVFIKEGTYKIASLISLTKSNITLQGTGFGTKVEATADVIVFQIQTGQIITSE